jgi:hypothetical protein
MALAPDRSKILLRQNMVETSFFQQPASFSCAKFCATLEVAELLEIAEPKESL